jgi:hypothetical protein
VIFGWSAVVLARHHDGLHLVFATILGLFMIWSIFMAGVLAWGLWRPPSDTEC